MWVISDSLLPNILTESVISPGTPAGLCIYLVIWFSFQKQKNMYKKKYEVFLQVKKGQTNLK